MRISDWSSDVCSSDLQHIFTVATLAGQGALGESFSSDFAILQDDRILADPLLPSGFLFHISRCGSTLTGKALARSPRHVVINQIGRASCRERVCQSV